MRRPIRSISAGTRRRFARTLAIPAVVASVALLAGTFNEASAVIVATVPLATAGNYSVLAGSTVTNTGPSVLDLSLGVSPGSAVTGFGPGTVTAPGTIETANAVSLQAQSDLTIAYDNAAGRTPDFFSVTGELTTIPGVPLLPGVYRQSVNGPLQLSGEMVLDGENNPNAIFIFQTNSTLITASNSRVTLTNGASACNVFWQVATSATIGTGSAFVGTIMALTSIAVQTGATVQGRALARNAATTLDNNVFTSTNCAGGPVVAAPTPVDTTPVDTTPLGPITPGPVTVATIPGFVGTDITLPRTGSKNVAPTSTIGGLALILGAGAILLARRRRPAT